MSSDTQTHTVRVTSWVAVGLIIAASILFGFALPMRSLTLAIIGAVVLVAGLVVAIAYRIMDEAH